MRQDIDIEQDESFQKMLRSIQKPTNKRDPRSVRLAAVTAAITEVVGQDAISAVKIYASIITTLEGTLQESRGSESLSTQIALLELLRKTLPHVALATIGATFSVSSRVLRAIVKSCQSVKPEEGMETKDELGGLNCTIRGACRASAEMLKLAPSTTTPENAIRQLFLETIVSLFDDRRPKVRKAAHGAACEILMTPQIHAALKASMTAFVHARLGGNDLGIDTMHLLAFLERAIVYLDIDLLGGDVMKILIELTQVDDSSSMEDFVAGFSKRDSNAKLLMINALLSVVLAVLDDESGNDKSNDAINAFSARVLASLLQVRPSLVFRSADTSISDNGRTLFGRAIVMSCDRVLASNSQVGYKFFPLSVRLIATISRPSDDAPSVEVAEAIMAEFMKLLRTNKNLVVSNGDISADTVDQCLKASLQALEVVMQHGYRPTWSATLPPLALLLQMRSEIDDDQSEILESLIKLRINVAQEADSRHAIDDAISSIAQGVGVETFWEWTLWNDAKDNNTNNKSQNKVINANRSWLLPLLKSAGMSSAAASRAHLAFFQKNILALARQCDSIGATTKKHEDSNFFKARVVDLWSFFSCFCVNPVDVSETLPSLTPTLIRAMGDERYPQLVTIICSGLKFLASGISERATESEDGKADAGVLAGLTTKLLPSLFKLVETLHGTTKSRRTRKDAMDVDDEDGQEGKKTTSQESQRVQAVTEAIAAWGRHADRSYLQGLFKKVIQRLLTATQSDEDETDRICTMLGLSQALVASESLDNDCIELLYRSMKPLIRSDEHKPQVQKRAYKVLHEIFQRHQSFATDGGRLGELTELLVGSLMTCQVSSRHLRLKCMGSIVNGFTSTSKKQMEMVPKIAGEVLICLKDSNAKTREAAFQLLLSLATAMNEVATFFQVLVAALGAQTSHMRSATVVAMSRLVFEFARSDNNVQALLPSLLRTVIVLFDENSREVVKSVVGFVRVSVAAMSPFELEKVLPELVGGLFKYHKGKDRFRAKIKIILKKLVRLYGYDKLMPLVPESDTRLLTHMRKLSERAARRKAAERPDGRPDATNFDEMMESDEDDSDDGRTLMTGATGFTRMTGRTGKSIRSAATERSVRSATVGASTMASTTSRKTAVRIRNDNDGNVLDMLDPGVMKSVRFAEDDDSDADDGSDLDDGAMEFDAMGRLVVPDDLDDKNTQNLEGDDDEEKSEYMQGVGKKRKLSKFESAKVAREEAKKKKGKSVKQLGAAYKSKKAGGDVKKKGQKFEPYAFVPLDGKSYSKKNRRKTVEQMSTVVRGGNKRKRN